MLHSIQNGLNLQLNGWFPRWMSRCLFNCRLIHRAGDQLFFSPFQRLWVFFP